jgi:XTP/dITP diphosphohydrolase
VREIDDSSSAPKRVVLASSNAGKLREFSELLAGCGFALARQSDFGISPPAETGTTFLENALIKARNAARIAGLPAVADDSGIEVDALDGAPGVHSARYAGEDAGDEANLDKLLAALSGRPSHQRGARYRCVIVYVDRADDPRPLIGEGSWEGSIIDGRRGAGGFGYDPSFVPVGDTRTVAEMPAQEKNLKSHRAQALRAFLAQLPRGGALRP